MRASLAFIAFFAFIASLELIGFRVLGSGLLLAALAFTVGRYAK
jgi:hypothetical protein